MAKAKPVTIYGIKSCDTMKRARAWLDGHGVAYGFHDYKATGIDQARIESWAREVGWESLLNRTGTTFRKLPEKDKEGLTGKKAIGDISAVVEATPASEIFYPIERRGIYGGVRANF